MKAITSCLLVCSLALLSACGGSSDSSIKKSGVVILDEVPVVRALICIDLDRNLSCDDGEPSAITDENGAFELRYPRRYSDRDFVVDGFAEEEAEVAFASRATKSTTVDPVRFFLTANQSSKTVSPLTTLVAVRARLMGGTAEDLAIAQVEVLTMLGLPTSTDLNNFDYVAQNNVKVMAISAAIADVFAASRAAILSEVPGASPVAALALSVSDLFTTPEGNQSRLGSMANAINYAEGGTNLALLVPQLVLSNTIPAGDVAGKLQDVETRIGLIDGRYLPRENGSVILDVITGLEWQRCVRRQTWNAGSSTCDGFTSGEAWSEPWDAQNGQIGPDGFAIPTVDQLRSLVYCSATNSYGMDYFQQCSGGARPAINQQAFPATPSQPHWTISHYGNNSEPPVPWFNITAWRVDFNTGYVSPSSRGTAYAHNRLVRAGEFLNQFSLTFDSAGGSAVAPITQDFAGAVNAPADPIRAGYTFAGWNPPVPATMPALNQTLVAKWTVPLPIDGRYLIIENGSIVRDVVTGLEWQRCSVGQTWNAQTSTCQGVASQHGGDLANALAAAGGFVLPTIEQLRTLVYCSATQQYDSNGNDDECGSGSASPAINQQVFPATPSDFFWSASPHPYYTGYAWTVDFGAGYVSPAHPGHLYWVRLVRAGQSFGDLTVTYTHTAGGSISGVMTQTLRPWTNAATVTAVPHNGYQFVGWDDGVDTAERTDRRLEDDLSAQARFERSSYSVSYTAGAGGTISGELNQTVLHGEPASTVTAQPNIGYTFAGWDDGVSSVSYTLNPVERDHAITAQFNPIQYTVTYGAASGGGITGVTNQTVNHGASATQVTAVPDVGYVFTQWSDGVTTANRTDTNITSSTSLTAQFVVLNYTLTYTASAGGTIQGAAEQSVVHGGSATAVTAVPNHGYRFVKWSDNDSTESQRVDSGVTGPLTANAEFELATFTLTYTAGAGGTLNAGVSENVQPNIVAFGDGTEVTAVASFGYSFDKWSDDVATAARTDTNVGEDLNVTALFTLNAAAPTNLQAVAGDALVTLSWDAVLGATSYKLYYARESFDVESYLSADGASLDLSVTSPYERSGMLNDTTYYFRVTAVTANGEGLPSGLVSATTEATVNDGLTRICVNGDAEGQGSCPTDPMVGSSDGDWGCTRDGATALMWAVNNFNNHFFNQATSDDRYFWFNDGTGDIPNGGEEGYSGDTDSCNEVYWWTYELCNTQNFTSFVNTNGGVCGSTQWRLPTRAELLTLWGEDDPLSYTIDDNYFPNFVQSQYLTSETNADNAEEFWTVELVLGQTQTQPKLFPGSPQSIWLVSDPAP
ncbi:MAG: DUF1566 domain-containing protein [Alcanivoracaceae bacterium]